MRRARDAASCRFPAGADCLDVAFRNRIPSEQF
jgi:hypothetical protein